MSTESKLDAANLAILQRGEIPAALRPDVHAVWRQASGQTLAAAGFVTLFILLLLVAPWFVAGFKTDTIGVWIFPLIFAVAFCVVYVVLVFEHLRRRQALLADVAANWVQQAEGEVFWKGSNYQARFPGQQAWSAGLHHYTGLMPGP